MHKSIKDLVDLFFIPQAKLTFQQTPGNKDTQ